MDVRTEPTESLSHSNGGFRLLPDQCALLRDTDICRNAIRSLSVRRRALQLVGQPLQGDGWSLPMDRRQSGCKREPLKCKVDPFECKVHLPLVGCALRYASHASCLQGIIDVLQRSPCACSDLPQVFPQPYVSLIPRAVQLPRFHERLHFAVGLVDMGAVGEAARFVRFVELGKVAAQRFAVEVP
jgi:hypothetical protein